jgi:hypothetical protein
MPDLVEKGVDAGPLRGGVIIVIKRFTTTARSLQLFTPGDGIERISITLKIMQISQIAAT